jgi:(hydroxyamino)benzene mutase
MSDTTTLQARLGHSLLRWGIVLFLLGLLTGFLLGVVPNPRVALSSHLEGVMNGTVLMVLGLLWTRLRLGDKTLRAGFWLALFGTYVNWGTTLIAAFLGAGEKMMPIASKGHLGTDAQELLIAVGLISLSVAMVAVSVIVLYGLRGGPSTPTD